MPSWTACTSSRPTSAPTSSGNRPAGRSRWARRGDLGWVVVLRSLALGGCGFCVRLRFVVPTGRVKWYEKDKGFGFLTSDDGGDVFVHKAALPSGVDELKAGQRVEFGVADGRKGAQ